MQKEQREHPPGMIDILCISLNVNISTSERRFRLNEWCLHYSIQVKCSSTTSPCFEGQPEKQETVLSFDSFRLRDFTIVIIKFAPSYLFSDHAKPVSLNVRNADDWHKKNLNTGKKRSCPGSNRDWRNQNPQWWPLHYTTELVEWGTQLWHYEDFIHWSPVIYMAICS